MATYYEPSGRFSFLSFLYLFLISLTALPLLAFGYAYATYYIPFIYINFLLTAGLGFGVGFVTNLAVLRLGKVRNTTLAALLGFLAGFITLYIQWAVWINILYSEADVDLGVINLILAPDALFALMGFWK